MEIVHPGAFHGFRLPGFLLGAASRRLLAFLAAFVIASVGASWSVG
jgi:hypothetical protein